MSGGSVPWKELALVGATTLGVCCAIGWWTGAENLKAKKKPQMQGGGPGGEMQEEQEIRTLLAHADQALKKGAFPEVERAYLMLLEITKQSEDPQIQTLTVHMHRRLADLYDRMGNYEKALKYLELCLDDFTSRDLVQDELSHVLVLAERAVDLSAAHSPQSKHEKFLRMWLETATKLNVTEYIVMASVLLGRLKVSQEKFVEAEAYLARALQPYTTNMQKEELWLSCKTLHIQCLTVLERHAAAKQGFREVADFILNSESNNLKRQLASIGSGGTDPNKVTSEILINMGDRCQFLGYYEEAEYIMKSNLALLKRKNASVTETATVDHGLAVVWSETGRLPQARDKIKEMKAYLHGNGLFPSYSKYLHTAGVKHEDEGTLVTLYLVKEGTHPARLLKTGSVLVLEFENPEADQPTIQVEYVVKDGEETVKVSAPVKYPSTSQMYSAEVTIFSNESKSEVIGTHFVFVPTGAAAFSPTTPSASLSAASILEAAAKSAAADATSSSIAATSSASSGLPPSSRGGLEDIVPGTTIRTPNGESIFVPATDAATINSLEEKIIQEDALQLLLQQMAMGAKGGDEGMVYMGGDEEDFDEEGEGEEDEEEGEDLLEGEDDEEEEEEEERLVLNK